MGDDDDDVWEDELEVEVEGWEGRMDSKSARVGMRVGILSFSLMISSFRAEC